MLEKRTDLSKYEKLTLADEFETFLGDESKDHLYQRLLYIWRNHGIEATKLFCINDADKFPLGEDRVKSYLENKLFDAGEDGLSKKTPWNNYKRQKAGLSVLHSFE
ncbi:MAG: hypothetical protein A2493_01740 [Candidatus Magasanikbacteria bacterium RIFOXYC12_FULL_33_11]|uniref:Uncharacterized protein n=1 Tax=Candidatus Magasanikbacteria bacterium RIFOXYC12_FULL_33_11 TaxID=1798701 RepID=A0A1F6NM76_9BACT|nr:MAG: hypothetical protein A2493_01740 [Candidatus Magasanikbacteria bacterium RIFOXYC12_FULL_33_11]